MRLSREDYRIDACLNARLPHVVGPDSVISDAISSIYHSTLSSQDMASDPPETPRKRSYGRKMLGKLQDAFRSPSSPSSSSPRLRDMPASSVDLHPLPLPLPCSPSQSAVGQPVSLSAPIMVEHAVIPSRVDQTPTLTVPGSSARPGANAEPGRGDKLKEAVKTAWAGLKLALEVLEKCSNVFPPLKSAVAELNACLGVIEVGFGYAQTHI